MHSTVITDTVVYRNALPAGAELMEYRLEGVLGAGGFGITYVAWDAHLHKRVAIKEYLPTDIALRALDGSVVPVATQRQDDYRSGLERFLLEARTLARFSHPHIVRVIRYFEANNTAYMAMDYEQGESMSRYLKRDPRPPEDRLLAILMPLLDGLRAVHEAGFLHRDIKPSNIFLREQGGPVLLDFGAARHTIGGTGNLTALLTPGYAPIEQYSADAKQGPWSDIYAVAGVFFRAVTDANPPDAVGRLRRDAVPQALAAARARYGELFLAAIGWGLEKEDHRRPQSVAEWQDGLMGRTRVPYTLERAVSEATEEPATRHAAPVASRRVPTFAATVGRHRWLALALAVAVAIVVLAFQRSRGPAPVQPAPIERIEPVDKVVEKPAAATQSSAVDKATRREPPKPAAGRESPRPAAARESPRPAAGYELPRPAARRASPPVEREPEATAPGMAADDGRAPVRDAVALPPLVEDARERPGRDRSARPVLDR